MRTLLLWLLILAQPIYGGASASLRMLGPAHWHNTPAVQVPGDDLLQPVVSFVQRVAGRVQSLREQAHVRAHARGTWHAHDHSSLQRHWHDAADGSVHTVGSADPAVADLVAGASVGSATLTLAAPVCPMSVAASAANGPWAITPASAWADADPRPTSPPPRR
ncbi:MAG: hypothetical protein C0460_15755 [Methylibium sp.]|jgi:hypothetical protein|nr:hypothetical protein [Methylibium sp.]|mmetsp:Transcript_17362/g.28341  ORF Transcript_17362/g.28341 Transcript_17362/m.28341 type:complete len:163 (-) Transcript_17362:3-491(-)